MKPSARNRPLCDLILFLRAERVTWQSLVYGDVTIDGAQDMKLLESLPPRKGEPPRPSIRERFGGPLLENPAPPAETFSPVIEEDD